MSGEPGAAPAGDAGVGSRLAAERSARGLSIIDVARQLKLSAWQVEALEANNYTRLPRGVFLRGFIRNYARLVGLDPAALIIEAEPQLPQSRPVPELPRSADIPFPSRRRIRWRPYALALLALVGAGAIFELYYRADNEVLVKSHMLQLQPNVEVSSPPAPPSAVVPAAPVAPPPAATADSNAAARANATASEAASEQAPAPSAQVAAGAGNLTFMFDKESWVEVRDRHGRRIFSQLNPAATRQNVSGEPPLTLVIGNAGGVRLQVNGAAFDLTPYIAVDVARLTLDNAP